jgi:hypothetical protein
MARTTNQPSTATRRNTAKTRAETNGRGSLDEQDQRNEDNQLGGNDERRENLAAVRDEQDDDRNDSRDDRDERGNFNGRNDREFGVRRDRDERRGSGEYAEQDSRREQGPALSAGLDTFAPVLEAWTQVFKSWSELTETMVKVQQDAFASMLGAGNAHAKDISLGDHRDGELAFSGSRATASTPDRIERDRDNR